MSWDNPNLSFYLEELRHNTDDTQTYGRLYKNAVTRPTLTSYFSVSGSEFLCKDLMTLVRLGSSLELDEGGSWPEERRDDLDYS